MQAILEPRHVRLLRVLLGRDPVSFWLRIKICGSIHGHVVAVIGYEPMGLRNGRLTTINPITRLCRHQDCRGNLPWTAAQFSKSLPNSPKDFSAESTTKTHDRALSFCVLGVSNSHLAS